MSMHLVRAARHSDRLPAANKADVVIISANTLPINLFLFMCIIFVLCVRFGGSAKKSKSPEYPRVPKKECGNSKI